eukprot:1285371-Karenia_brevis.AAC.1
MTRDYKIIEDCVSIAPNRPESVRIGPNRPSNRPESVVTRLADLPVSSQFAPPERKLLGVTQAIQGPWQLASGRTVGRETLFEPETV